MATLAASERLNTLAKPKPIPAGFIDDRRSLYCDNGIAKEWSSGSHETKFSLSARLEQLVLPKLVHKEWQGDRPSPIWLVSSAALKSEPSDRIKTLAEPNGHHKEFQQPKSAFTVVTSAALNAKASDRIEALAKPKQYQELPIKPDSCWDYSEWESDVSKAALKHDPSARTLQLSASKTVHKDYKESRPVVWNVSKSARKALPSIRVLQLARPKSRSQYKEDYESNWWKVSPGAKSARPTPRVEELALPVPRKVRQKKQGGAQKS